MLDVHKEAKEKMDKTIAVYREDLQSIRAGRANTALLDRIMVDYYGQMTPLNQVAGIAAPEPRLLTISPWEVKMIPIIEKAIMKSNLGITPSNDGKIIRLVIPQLTEERRVELTKIVKKDAENAKIAIRNTRRDIIERIKKMEKNKELTEDEMHSAEEKMQEITDEKINEIDKITKSKEEELLEI
ncbi:MAG: ribosome recycling factor [Tissierellia bacterium]|nr:ribosome recycling factor [Tissierellia bacterium]